MKFTETNNNLNFHVCNQEIYDQLIFDISNYTYSNIFDYLGKELLLTVLLPSRNNQFTYPDPKYQLGFEYQRNYTGLMATKKREQGKTKRGLFDFKIKVDNSVDKAHYQIFKELLEFPTLSNCVNVWTGNFSPSALANNSNEEFALEELMLMMFEQEVNWGDEDFQAYSAFSRSKFAKPRDMLMGFINIVFTNKKVNAIPNWQWNKKTNPPTRSTPDFGGPYAEYDVTLKNTYFEPYRSHGGALMQGEIADLFKRTASLFLDNPLYRIEK